MPDACFARVAVNDPAQSLLVDAQAIAFQSGSAYLPRQQVIAGDLDFLLSEIAGELDDLHPIEQWSGNRVELVRRAHEENLREVDVQVEIVVSKTAVLFRVEHLQQSGCGIALIAGSDLVDLVQHDDRVLGAGFSQCADQLAGQRADVGAAVALDFGFIAHAAYRETMKLPAHGVGDGAPEGGLANARGADEEQDRAADVALHQTEAEKLQNAFLDVIEPVVASIEARGGRCEVLCVLARDAPG